MTSPMTKESKSKQPPIYSTLKDETKKTSNHSLFFNSPPGFGSWASNSKKTEEEPSDEAPDQTSEEETLTQEDLDRTKLIPIFFNFDKEWTEEKWRKYIGEEEPIKKNEKKKLKKENENKKLYMIKSPNQFEKARRRDQRFEEIYLNHQTFRSNSPLRAPKHLPWLDIEHLEFEF